MKCRTPSCKRTTYRPGNPAKFSFCITCSRRLLGFEPMKPNGRAA